MRNPWKTLAALPLVAALALVAPAQVEEPGPAPDVAPGTAPADAPTRADAPEGAPAAAGALGAPVPLYVPERTLKFQYTAREEGHVAAGLDQVILQVSRDEGQSWKDAVTSHAVGQPLLYTVSADGRYGFRMIAVDLVGNREHKPNQPEMIVVVDTAPPRVKIHNPAPSRFYKAGAPLMLHWEVDDANLRLDAVTVRYALNNELNYRLLKEEQAQRGKLPLELPGNTRSARIRIDARDLAGNEGHSDYYVAQEWIYPPHVDALNVVGLARYQRSRRFVVAYGLASRYSQGIQSVTLWHTMDQGLHWEKLDTDQALQHKFQYTAQGDGWIGFYLVGAYEQGFTSTPDPETGTQPMASTLVDTRPPQIELLTPSAGGVVWEGGQEHLIRWQAGDNVVDHPLEFLLEYSLHGGAGGSWRQIPMDPSALKEEALKEETVPKAAAPVDANAESGSVVITRPAAAIPLKTYAYVWLLPRFTCKDLRVRITAKDMVGNQAARETQTIQVLHAAPKVEAGVTVQRPKVDVAYLEARWLLGQGKFKEAVDKYQELLRRNPQHAEAYADLGFCYIQLKQVSEGIEHLNHAAELQPHNPRIYFQLAEAHWLKNNYATAVRYYEVKVLGNEPVWESLSLDEVDQMGSNLTKLAQQIYALDKNLAEALRIARVVLGMNRLSKPVAEEALKLKDRLENVQRAEIK